MIGGPEAVDHALRELLTVDALVHELATGFPVGSVATAARMVGRLPGLETDQVWMQVEETITYQVTPYEVLQHLLRWVDDYRAGQRWR